MDGPVHWLENVDCDPSWLRTACGRFQWEAPNKTELLDPQRAELEPVTCPECLEAMTKPIIVGAT